MIGLYKVELFFDETLSEAELKKLGSKIDKIFAEETITRVDKTLTSRIYYDNGTKFDYGYMMEAIGVLDDSFDIRKHLISAYWYNDEVKEDIITEFFNCAVR